MRFLVDENLSPRVAEALEKGGHDAVHVRDLQATGELDSAIMMMGSTLDRIIVSADTDFGTLLAAERLTKPSVILVREIMGLRPFKLVGTILQHLDLIANDLEAGAIVAFGRKAIRVRRLPLR